MTSLGYVELGMNVWSDVDHRQTLHMSDFEIVELVDEFLDPTSGEWLETSHYGGASFGLFHMSGAGPDVFACGGIAANGDIVLERWKLNRNGVPELEPALYGEPLSLPPSVGFRKKEIYRGPLGTDIYSVDLDPQYRYMIALVGTNGSHVLYQFDIQQVGPPVVLLDSSTVPEIDQMFYAETMDHYQLGRTCVLREGLGGQNKIVLVDSNNDGVFDGAPLVGDRGYFASLGLDDHSDWDDFRRP